MPKNINRCYFKFYNYFNKINKGRIERKDWRRMMYCKIAICLNPVFYFMN